MTITVTTTRRTDLADLADLLAAHRPFKNSSGSLTGRTGYAWDIGQMGETEAEQLRTDQPVYVVKSYATPIAWQRSDGTWYVTGRKYSVTTGQHVSQIRRAVANLA